MALLVNVYTIENYVNSRADLDSMYTCLLSVYTISKGSKETCFFVTY